ncbi:hypothetical protein A9R04_12130 [Nocardiopsis dassonvillei]|nr:hypothetical protein A9R04_12130 [Nocardiopsis dassonvillei]
MVSPAVQLAWFAPAGSAVGEARRDSREDVGAWVLSAVLFVAGVFLVLRPPRRRFVRFGC